jgi:plastocyanin
MGAVVPLALLLGAALTASDSVAAAAGAPGAAGAAGARRPAEHTVTIEGMQYHPAELTVRRGDRIIWVNKDFFPHTVTADNKAFDSHSIAANASWSYVARRTGEYAYGCTLHPGVMKGRISVQ